MKDEIRIHASGIGYIPKKVVDSGFVGGCPVELNHISMVIFHPESDLEDRIKSLKIVVQDLELQNEIKNKKQNKKNRKKDE